MFAREPISLTLTESTVAVPEVLAHFAERHSRACARVEITRAGALEAT